LICQPVTELTQTGVTSGGVCCDGSACRGEFGGASAVHRDVLKSQRPHGGRSGDR
jgi:hypothetical protein